MLVTCSIGCTSHQSLILYIVAINIYCYNRSSFLRLPFDIPYMPVFFFYDVLTFYDLLCLTHAYDFHMLTISHVYDFHMLTVFTCFSFTYFVRLPCTI